jgi:hypothetical protein
MECGFIVLKRGLKNNDYSATAIPRQAVDGHIKTSDGRCLLIIQEKNQLEVIKDSC